MGALDDGMNSLQRYYLNNFLDADRQEGVDLLTGHQLFSHAQGDDDDDEDGAHAQAQPPLSEESLTIEEAARRVLFESRLSAMNENSDSEDESAYEPIKVRSRTTGPFGLLWLPGDLQEQVKRIISPGHKTGTASGSSSSLHNAVLDIDRRASSNLPWWFVADSSDDDDDTTITTDSSLIEVEASASNNAGYMLGALLAGIQTPNYLMGLVLGLLCSVHWHTRKGAEEDDAHDSVI